MIEKHLTGRLSHSATGFGRVNMSSTRSWGKGLRLKVRYDDIEFVGSSKHKHRLRFA